MPRRASLAAAVLVAAAALAACARPAPPPKLRQVVAPAPLSVARRDPAIGSSWVIVYSPHPDDESIGMGQAIRRWVNAGYNVQVVLLTDGETSHAYQDYYRRRPELWADLNHNGVRGDPGDFGLERRREFQRATATLGVPLWRLSYYGIAGGKDGLSKDFCPESRVTEIMRSFERKHPGALHMTVMKHTDGNWRGIGDALPQGEHRAACDALLSLVRADKVRARFYKIYVYDLPASHRWAQDIEYDPVDHQVKRRAMLSGYDDADQPGHLAIGWHSVPVAIDNVLADPNEYAIDASAALAGS